MQIRRFHAMFSDLDTRDGAIHAFRMPVEKGAASVNLLVGFPASLRGFLDIRGWRRKFTQLRFCCSLDIKPKRKKTHVRLEFRQKNIKLKLCDPYVNCQYLNAHVLTHSITMKSNPEPSPAASAVIEQPPNYSELPSDTSESIPELGKLPLYILYQATQPT